MPFIANGAVTRGHSLAGTTTAGRVAGAAFNAANNVRAIALDDAGAAGDVFTALLT